MSDDILRNYDYFEGLLYKIVFLTDHLGYTKIISFHHSYFKSTQFFFLCARCKCWLSSVCIHCDKKYLAISVYSLLVEYTRI